MMKLLRMIPGVTVLLVIALAVPLPPAYADNTPQSLTFTQDWTNISLITVDDNWSGVPGVVGFRGDGLAGGTGVNPQTVLGESAVVDVTANNTNPNGFTTGGVAEFHITNPVVALQGSGTARAPHIQFHVNTTGRANITVAYNLRDVDGSADNAVQPVALQFRVGSTGTFTNLPAGFVADATTGPSLATLVTAVSVTLPAAADNKPVVQIRVITTDAVGSDEWVGIDDISIAGTATEDPTNPTGVGAASPNAVAIGSATLLTVTVTPGANPVSTGLAVSANLTSIGGASSQQFFDDNTHGDTTAGDNVFSFSATVANGTTSGAKSLVATIVDAESRPGTATISLTVLGPTSPSGVGSANPSSVQPGDFSLLTVNVTPGTNPPSTGIIVVADLSSIGGSSSQFFAGNGNTFTFQATVAMGTSPGAKNLPVTITDSEVRSGTTSIILTVEPPLPPVDHIVISQIYGGGGNAGAAFNRDFVELFNPGTTSIDVTGWSIQYSPATGNSNPSLVQALAGVIAPGQYYLISLGTNNTAVGAPLPVEANVVGEFNMAAGAAKLALVNASEVLSASCPVGDPRIVDYVGYGSTANCREGAANAPAATNSLSIFRKNGGSTDTNNNANDFQVGTPNPRRTAPIAEVGPRVVNTDPSTNNTTAPRDSSITIDFSEPVDVIGTWFSVTCVTTGVHDSFTFAHTAKTQVITPNANFLPGEQCTVIIFQNGVHDTDTDDLTPATDTLPADYTWTFTVATGTAPAFGPEVHLMMGNPSNAIDLPSVPNNFLMVKPEFALSYNRDRGTPNWVSWHLSDEWNGSGERTDTFRPDPAVPADWYRVQAFDYSGSGFDRGHMTPSADRRPDTSIPINQATFLMSNMVPQSPDNNQGPWARMENDLRALLPANELYIVSGPAGIGGTNSNGLLMTTLANGRVTVPAWTWKVALVLPKLDGNDVARVTASARTIAVIMPNIDGINAIDWQTYLVSVDQVEGLSGYDFFSNVSDIVENSVEAGINGVNPPGVANQSVSTPEDAPRNLTLEAVSANSNPLTYTIVTSPAHGTLTGADAFRTYTPAPNFNGNDSFTFRVSDGALSSGLATVTITISAVNDAPTAGDDTRSTNEDTASTFAASELTANDTAGPANENGQTLTVSAVSATSSTHGTVSLSNGQVTYAPEANFNGTASFTYQVCDNGISAGLSDSLCATATVVFTVNAVNDPPSVSISAPSTSPEGTLIAVTATATDVDGTFTYAWTATKNGSPYANGNSNPFAFTPDDNGTYAVSLTVTDDGGATGSASASVLVTNVAPVIASVSGPIAPLALGATASVSISYTDMGAADTHTATFVWDDGSSSIVNCNAGTCTGSRTFGAAGVYTVQVVLSDDDGGTAAATFASVIVFDATAGHVTGGGWIESATGKASYGFNSKYQKGELKGNTEFQVANINFHSTAHDVLVVRGTRAQFRGTGTINGSGSYGFILTMVDGDVDKFRMKIWNRSSGAVVYDNVAGASDDIDDANPQPVGGGNLVIH